MTYTADNNKRPLSDLALNGRQRIQWVNGNSLWRTEIKTLQSMNAIFTKGSGYVNNNTELTASLAISF